MAKEAEYEPKKEKLTGKVPTKKVTAKLIEDRYFKGLKSTANERKEFWLNDSFLRGNQWIYWNDQTHRVGETARGKGRIQATIDRLSPSSRTIMAKLLQRELVFEVRPNGSDDASVQGAKTAEAVVRDLHIKHDWEVLREDLAWAVWTGGTAAICVDWDPEAGDFVDSDEEEGDTYEGDTCETVLTIPEFVVEPGARRAEKARWWIKGIVLEPETAQAMYGLKETPPDNSKSSMSPHNERIITPGGGSISQDAGTLVLTYYERPNKANPEGCVATVIDSQIVESKPWPFPFDDHLNLTVVRETPLNSKWAGETILSKAAKVQVFMNAAWSNYQEHLKKVGNARLMVPATQMEMSNVLSDDPGIPIKFMDGPGAGKPEYLSPPNMPAWVINIIQELSASMDDIIGLHDVSRGNAPTNIESGVGLSVLSENDNTPVGRLSKEVARGFSNMATMDLEIIQDNMVGEKEAVIHGPGNQPPETVPWSGQSLAGQTNVNVPVEKIMPRSKAEQFAMAERLVQMRPDWFQSPADFMAVAEVQGSEDILWAVDEQTALARRYNYYLAEGTMVEPQPWHDATIFIRELNRFRCTPRFEQLPDERKELFQIVIDGYETMAEEQMGKQVAKGIANPALAATPTADGAPQLPLSAAGAMPEDTAGMLASEGAPPGPDQPQQQPPVGG